MTKYYIKLKDGTRKFFDWTCSGLKESMQYVIDNSENINFIDKEQKQYKLYVMEIKE